MKRRFCRGCLGGAVEGCMTTLSVSVGVLGTAGFGRLSGRLIGMNGSTVCLMAGPGMPGYGKA